VVISSNRFSIWVIARLKSGGPTANKKTEEMAERHAQIDGAIRKASDKRLIIKN